MAKPNYSFEKRKRELAKKAAKEAKRLRKEEKATSPEARANSDQPAEDTADGSANAVSDNPSAEAVS